jgi:signal transduction histidine kinase
MLYESTILLVDDEPDILEILKVRIVDSGLVKEENIHTASDGLMGLRLVEEKSPDVIITDLRMPTMSGKAFLTKLRGYNSSVEVIVLSAAAEIPEMVGLFSLNISAYVPKGDNLGNIAMFLERSLERIAVRKHNEDLIKRLLKTDKFASIGFLASGLAHEIHKPNTLVRDNLRLMKDSLQKSGATGKVHDDVVQLIDSALHGTERIGNISFSLRQYAATPKAFRSMTMSAGPLDLALSLTSHKTAKHKVSLSLASDLRPLMLDTAEISQVFLNIILNAAYELDHKYPQGGGNIWISVAEDQSRKMQVFRFKDDGRGIPKETLKSVLDPFFTTKPTGTGAGLGLSIANGIISAHGGAISCTSQEGEWTEVEISLPWPD